MSTDTQDPFRLADVCMFQGCGNDEIDQRGPVFLLDGSIHKACVEHWEPIMRVLGEQATWETRDGARWAGVGDHV